MGTARVAKARTDACPFPRGKSGLTAAHINHTVRMRKVYSSIHFASVTMVVYKATMVSIHGDIEQNMQRYRGRSQINITDIQTEPSLYGIGGAPFGGG